MLIVQVETASELDQIRELFRQYFQFLIHDHGLGITCQGIQAELASLPGKYAAPQGRLIMAVESGEPVGCAALRPLDDRICELKRMYVQPKARGRGVGKALAGELIQDARRIGYDRIRLDTAIFLTSAVKLYESLGFQRIPPYNDLPEEIRQKAIFMEFALS
jgi:GNAT superfamily N-acetyltransferase